MTQDMTGHIHECDTKSPHSAQIWSRPTARSEQALGHDSFPMICFIFERVESATFPKFGCNHVARENFGAMRLAAAHPTI